MRSGPRLDCAGHMGREGASGTCINNDNPLIAQYFSTIPEREILVNRVAGQHGWAVRRRTGVPMRGQLHPVAGPWVAASKDLLWLRECFCPDMGKLLLSLFLLLLPLTAAADVSGKWSGSMDIKAPDATMQSTPVTAEFKQDGRTVTGTAGREGDDQLTIENGLLDGGTLTFDVEAPDGKYSVSLKLVGDTKLEGETTFSDPNGNKLTAKLTFERAK